MKRFFATLVLGFLMQGCDGPTEVKPPQPKDPEVISVNLSSDVIATEFPDTIRFEALVKIQGRISDNVSFHAKFGKITLDRRFIRTQGGVQTTVYEAIYAPPFEEVLDTVWVTSTADDTKSDFETVDVNLSDDGYIAFHATRNYNGDIYIIRPDGTGLWRVTTDLAEDVFPTWSPDGMRIIFAHSYIDRPGTELFSVRPDGTNLTKLTAGIDYAIHPAMAPDGKRLAFMGRTTPSDPFEIMALNLESGELIAVTHEGLLGGKVPTNPAWSPDGTKIVYHTFRDGNWEIYVANADGTGEPTNLTNNPEVNDVLATWSPDGTKIVFGSAVNGSGIYFMNPDGSDQVRVITDGGWPTWSPDGKWIIFARTHSEDNIDFWKVNLESGEEMRVTNTPDWVESSPPAWGMPKPKN